MACKLFASELQILTKSTPRIAAIGAVRCYADEKNLEKKTHTGQIFEKDDYRNVRFINSTRYVNPNWGIKLIDEIPPKECCERVVYCDGGNGPLGHPKVYINLDKPGAHTCGYCGLRFIKADHHH